MDYNNKNNADFENEDEQEEQNESELIEKTEADIDGIDNISEMPEIQKTQEMADASYFIPEQKRAVEEIFDWLEIFSSALITVILLFTFIFRLVTVQGPSMEHTLHGGELDYGTSQKDNLIISRFNTNPKQGDIVVIQVPNPIYDTPIIKRVIATAGQTVDINFQTWVITVDGQPLDEPYVNYDYMTDENGNQVLRPMAQEDIPFSSLPITVEPGKIFVMGDNRNHSSDSRSSTIGQVDVRDVVGRVMIRVFPFNKFGIVKPNEQY